MKRYEYLQHLTPVYFYEFLRNFSKEHITDNWCKAKCPKRIDPAYLGDKDCKLDLEREACPYSDDDLLKIWLDEEVEDYHQLITGEFVEGQEVTVIIQDRQLTATVQRDDAEGLYIFHYGFKYYDFEFER